MAFATVERPMRRSSPMTLRPTDTERQAEEDSEKLLRRKDSLPETILHGCSDRTRTRDSLDPPKTRQAMVNYHLALSVFL